MNTMNLFRNMDLRDLKMNRILFSPPAKAVGNSKASI